jgi:hypothetical protein
MQEALRVRRDPYVRQQRVPIHLAGRNRHEEITHIGKRLDPVPLRARQDAEASRRRLPSAVAPDEHPDGMTPIEGVIGQSPFRSVEHCTAPAKVRMRLLLETGSKPQEKRLILPVFPFAGFEAPPWPTPVIVPRVERKSEESVSRPGHSSRAPGQGLLQSLGSDLVSSFSLKKKDRHCTVDAQRGFQ